jgi:nickel-dependent lactate racemase
MKVHLAYGQGQLMIDLPGSATLIQPTPTAGLPDERAAVFTALDKPIRANPLRESIKTGDRVCIVFTDITRATPNERLIPWLLEYLTQAPAHEVTLLNGLGTHRPNSTAELDRMLTPQVTQKYRVLNHEPENADALIPLGTTADGTPALLNRHLVNSNVRIITGFIEPHFFAGFSGGPKGIMPGVAGLKTIMSNHGHRNLGSPKAAFGIAEGNPLWEELRDIALRPGPSFLLNVALNEQRQITGVFAGDLLAAHRVGCDFVRSSAMQKVEEPFDVVVTTNSGYPLDLNLYQGVKGMSAAVRIVKPGGTIIMACECSQGVPANCSYDRILRSASSPQEILAMLAAPGFSRPEQWQAQIQALIQTKARVLLYSSLPVESVHGAHLTPCLDISATVQQMFAANSGLRIAVLPQGPLTIPYLG